MSNRSWRSGWRPAWLTLFVFALACLAVTLYQIRGPGVAAPQNTTGPMRVWRIDPAAQPSR
ncbi:MAG: hypothetical protein A4S15_10630 [Candidatus Raskinella chloraquaticus]|uniref:Uncharacterized protein n=1 Tax=Candidatus Raskinella chloraquaticus TaxID=1951219 RepID=A0A1W9HW62_9HYPH|nr:MAG: hypothetical protein A4S15_10630 [Proteobacteria bacterium SG_bin8]